MQRSPDPPSIRAARRLDPEMGINAPSREQRINPGLLLVYVRGIKASRKQRSRYGPINPAGNSQCGISAGSNAALGSGLRKSEFASNV